MLRVFAWIKQGRFYSKAQRTAWGRERGIRSGLARRKRTQDRDQAIVQAWLCGASMRSLARLHGLSGRAVHHIAHRDAPLFRGVTRTTQVSQPRLFMRHVDKGFQPGVFVRSEPGFS